MGLKCRKYLSRAKKPICAAVLFWMQILFYNYATQSLKKGWADNTSQFNCVCPIKVFQTYNEATSKFHSFIQGLFVAESTSFVCGVNFSWHWYHTQWMINGFMRPGKTLRALLCVKLVFNNLFISISHALKCQRCLRLVCLTQRAVCI